MVLGWFPNDVYVWFILTTYKTWFCHFLMFLFMSFIFVWYYDLYQSISLCVYIYIYIPLTWHHSPRKKSLPLIIIFTFPTLFCSPLATHMGPYGLIWTRIWFYIVFIFYMCFYIAFIWFYVVLYMCVYTFDIVGKWILHIFDRILGIFQESFM